MSRIAILDAVAKLLRVQIKIDGIAYGAFKRSPPKPLGVIHRE